MLSSLIALTHLPVAFADIDDEDEVAWARKIMYDGGGLEEASARFGGRPVGEDVLDSIFGHPSVKEAPDEVLVGAILKMKLQGAAPKSLVDVVRSRLVQPLIVDTASFEPRGGSAINAVLEAAPGLCDGVDAGELIEIYEKGPDRELALLISRCCETGGRGLENFVMRCFEEGCVDVVESVVRKDPEAGKGLIKHASEKVRTLTPLPPPPSLP